MGIEPTNRTFYVRPNGFEGRAEHQLKKHFPESMRIKKFDEGIIQRAFHRELSQFRR